MRGLLDNYEEAGSAVCRFVFIDDVGLWTNMPEVRRRTSGLYPDGLRTIASVNWAQFAAVVLRRSLVEAVGGFHPSLFHAADWDLWKRAILHQPVAYEPTVLACYRMFEGNDTSRLIKTGANIADSRRAIDLSAHYLPHPESASWIRVARLNLAHQAKQHAVQMSVVGDYEAFRSLLREACLLQPAFYWSPRHFRLRYRFMKQSLKQRLIERKGWLSKRRLLEPDTASAST